MPRAMMKGTVIGPGGDAAGVEGHRQEFSAARKAARQEHQDVATPSACVQRRFLQQGAQHGEGQEHAHARRPRVRISTMSGTAGTWRASTCKSGSAMVMNGADGEAHSAMTPASVCTLAHDWLPTCSPMGIMAMSAPRVRKPRPIISRHGPQPGTCSSAAPQGISGRHRECRAPRTMAVMGMTADRDSRVFAFKFFRIHTLRFRFGFSR